MRNLEDIKKEIAELGFNTNFMIKKEVNELPSILRDDEKIFAITNGFYDNNTWLVLCTSSRFLFLDKGMLFGLKQTEIPLDKVNSIQFNTGLILGDVTIWDGSGKIKIDNIDKKFVKKFADMASDALESYKKTKNNPIHITQSASGPNKMEQLEKLAELKAKGILTEEEFTQEKKKLLAA